ncbi:putative monothiol glutaredoxin-S5 [Iris pallida]|uniref:Monothiol glutaredoxin-S5 n=1 Tax=Iris pallida TaxID=29817 RepID=A0AAX6DTW8_IRIPA|nr:putative monothiol glutaredoxin-S5 [Iris pallida]
MQQANPTPYTSSSSTWPFLGRPSSSLSSPPSTSLSTTTSGGSSSSSDGIEWIRGLAADNPVLVVGRSDCCMCHVVRSLLLGLGANPAVCEVGDEIDDETLGRELAADVEKKMLFPAVFIGGKLVGGLDRLMAVHIAGELVPTLKKAGALWL